MRDGAGKPRGRSCDAILRSRLESKDRLETLDSADGIVRSRRFGASETKGPSEPSCLSLVVDDLSKHVN